MKKSFLLVFIFVFAGIHFAWAQKVDKSKLIGTWSYEKTESNLTGKGVTLKVFEEWLITFNKNGTYWEQSSLGGKKKPEAKGSYKLQGDTIIRSQNKVQMKILVLNEKELVITSSPKSKIFFIKK